MTDTKRHLCTFEYAASALGYGSYSIVLYLCFEVQLEWSIGSRFWITDGMNFQPVNFCPKCGEKAPISFDEHFDPRGKDERAVEQACFEYNCILEKIPESVEVP